MMRNGKNIFRDFLSREDGSTAIEYGLIATAVGLTVAAVMPELTSSTKSPYEILLQRIQDVVN